MNQIIKINIHFVDENGNEDVATTKFDTPVGVENTPSVYLAIKDFFDNPDIKPRVKE
jgi:hypothetical protein